MLSNKNYVNTQKIYELEGDQLMEGKWKLKHILNQPLKSDGKRQRIKENK